MVTIVATVPIASARLRRCLSFCWANCCSHRWPSRCWPVVPEDPRDDVNGPLGVVHCFSDVHHDRRSRFSLDVRNARISLVSASAVHCGDVNILPADLGAGRSSTSSHRVAVRGHLAVGHAFTAGLRKYFSGPQNVAGLRDVARMVAAADDCDWVGQLPRDAVRGRRTGGGRGTVALLAQHSPLAQGNHHEGSVFLGQLALLASLIGATIKMEQSRRCGSLNDFLRTLAQLSRFFWGLVGAARCWSASTPRGCRTGRCRWAGGDSTFMTARPTGTTSAAGFQGPAARDG